MGIAEYKPTVTVRLYLGSEAVPREGQSGIYLLPDHLTSRYIGSSLRCRYGSVLTHPSLILEQVRFYRYLSVDA